MIRIRMGMGKKRVAEVVAEKGGGETAAEAAAEGKGRGGGQM